MGHVKAGLEAKLFMSYDLKRFSLSSHSAVSTIPSCGANSSTLNRFNMYRAQSRTSKD